MISPKIFIFTLLTILLSLSSCVHDTGSKTGQFQFPSDDASAAFDLDDIQENGELIVLSTYGAATFFEFRGENFGLQYMIANAFAKEIGTGIRVERCRDERELMQRLLNGDGDIVISALAPSDTLADLVNYCGSKPLCLFLDSIATQRKDTTIAPNGRKFAWATRKDSPQLTKTLNDWLTAHSKDFKAYTTIRVRTSSGKVYTPRRKVSAPILNAALGQISIYDDIFKRYAAQCHWDWRLIAAQSYQESAFDPEAVSFMGAMGLMQLMPSTARSVGVSQDDVFNPEDNVRGAVRLIIQLNTHYSSIKNEDERINFILAAYNAGPGHVDDARALAKKYGKDPDVWLHNTDTYVLNMSHPDYYNQPEVHHGYFRGFETYDYVNSIRSRWSMYREKIRK